MPYNRKHNFRYNVTKGVDGLILYMNKESKMRFEIIITSYNVTSGKIQTCFNLDSPYFFT